MNTRKYLAALLAIYICLLSGCGGKKAEDAPVTTAPGATETALSQETTAPELPQDEKMDLLSFADQIPEETASAETAESVPAATEAVKETTPAPVETAPAVELPAITTPEGETVPMISGNENQLPLG